VTGFDSANSQCALALTLGLLPPETIAVGAATTPYLWWAG
jgi:hypothetical protein